MLMLVDAGQTIQFEAFQIFLLFIQESNLNERIKRILRNNKDQLIEYLNNFQNERAEKYFLDLKKIVISYINGI